MDVNIIAKKYGTTVKHTNDCIKFISGKYNISIERLLKIISVKESFSEEDDYSSSDESSSEYSSSEEYSSSDDDEYSSSSSSPNEFSFENVLCKDVSAPRSFDIYNLLCTRLLGGSLSSIFNSENCNPISRIISENLIKVSALKIFADPEKCFLELIVNSIDVHRKSLHGDRAPSIGKFGMGFFSVFYYVLKHNAIVFITSGYVDEYNKVCSWSATVTNIHGKLHVNVHSLGSGKDTGTSITVGVSRNISPPILEKIKGFIRCISVEPEIQIIESLISNPPKRYILVTARESINKSQMLFTVSDNSIGISLQNFFGNMMLPSLSSKTMGVLLLPIALPNFTRIVSNSDGRSELVLSVGGIPVISINDTMDSGKNMSYYIDFDVGTTNLPVARDDIFIDESSSVELRKNIMKIVDEIIDKYPTELHQFLKLLDMYVAKTEQSLSFDIIDECKRNIIALDNIILINDEVLPSALYIPNSKLIYFENVNIPLTTDKLVSRMVIENSSHSREISLDSSFETSVIYSNLIKGKYVVFIDADKSYYPSDGGLPSFLFIPVEITSFLGWKGGMVSSYTRSRLEFTDDDGISSDIIDILLSNKDHSQTREYAINYSKRLISKSKDFNLLLLGLYNALSKKEEIYGKLMAVKSIVVFAHHSAFLSALTSLLSIDTIKRFTMDLINYISSASVSVVYGREPTLIFDKIEYFGIRPLRNAEFSMSDKYRSLVQSTIEECLYDSLYISTASRRFSFDVCVFTLISERCIFNPEVVNDFTKRVWEIMLLHQTNNIESKFVGETIDACEQARTLTLQSPIHLEQIIKFLYREYRERFGNEFSGMYLDYCGTFFEAVLYSKVIQTLGISLNLYLRSAILKGNNTITPLIIPVMNISFTTEKLLSFIFERGDSNLDKVAGYSQVSPNQFQIVKIAANAGTSKEFIPSVLTELVQNSVDALRATSTPGTIYISFGKMSIHNKTRTYISVRDPVGIPLKHIPSLMIPFYSSKTTGTTTEFTGEMGTGFFNVFRQPYTEKVIIITSAEHDEYETFIQGTPIFDDEQGINKKFITDIKWDISQNPKTHNGTNVIIVLADGINSEEEPKIPSESVNSDQRSEFSAEPRINNIDIETDASIFIRGKLSGIPNVNIMFNNQLITEHYITVYSNDYAELRVSGMCTSPSMIYTNGIPFMELGDFIKKNYGENLYLPGFSTGIIIDLNKRVYFATQSRTNISGENIQQIVYNYVFFAIMYKYSITENPVDYSLMLLHASSTADPNQLVIGDNESMRLDNILFNHNIINFDYGSFFSNTPKTLASEINNLIKFKKANHNYLPREYFEVNSDEFHIYQVIKIWFSNKIYDDNSTRIISVISGNSVKNSEVSGMYRRVLYVFNIFVNCFWEFLKKIDIDITVNDTPPRIILAEIESAAGFYNVDEHTITMNVSNLPSDRINHDVASAVHKLKTDGELSAVSFINSRDYSISSVFGNQVKANTLIHELYHAIRQDEHLSESGSHGSFKYTLDGVSHNHTFDQGIFEIYGNILSHGFWVYFLESLMNNSR